MSTLGDAADVNPVIKFLPHKFVLCGCVAACCHTTWINVYWHWTILRYKGAVNLGLNLYRS